MATPVEATSAPKLHEVVDELQTCHADWYLIGVYLKLSAAELDTVEANNPKVVMRFTRMITRWLKNKTNPSWSDLVRALRKIKEHAVADRIAKKFCRPEVNQPVVMVESKQPVPQHASEKQPNGHNESLLQPQSDLESMSTQDLPVAPLPAEEDACLDNLSEKEMCDIGIEFSFMFATIVQLLSRVVPVETLKTFLNTFRHPSTMIPYISTRLYRHCKTTAQVLKALEPLYINSMHTYLLRKIVQKFGCVDAKKAVEAYDVNFPWTVALKDLGDPLPEWVIDACPGAKRLKVVVKRNADTVSGQDLETFQTSLQNSLQIDRVVIVFAKLEPANSVALIFLVPECVSVVGSLRNDGQKLMDLAASGIMTIEAEGDTIEVEVEGKFWMHRMMRMKDSDELSVDSGFGGSVVGGSRRSSFSEEVPSDAPTRDDEEALKFAADLTANRTTPRREFVMATISDRAAAALGDGLSNNRSLRELILRECKISSVGVAALASALSSNTSLKTLHLWNCGITDDSMVELSQALMQNETLEELDLGNQYSGNDNTITHVGVTSLSEALLSNKSLKTLNLGGNKLVDQGVCSIAEALHGNETLQSLDLGYNNISNQGATALAKSLETNRSIETLDLGGNRIADQGVCAIADALHGNETLQSLDLDGNNISNEGATALAKLLETNKAIKTLDLWGNRIADQGVCTIADALHGNVTLESLDLSHNTITDVGILALSAMLPLNKSLQHLVISLRDVTDEGVRQLALGLEGSTSLKTLRLWRTKHISRETMKILRDSAQRKEIELK